MAKTLEEMNELKEVETLNEKLTELTDEELEHVTGGGSMIWASKCKFTGQLFCTGHRDECGLCQGIL